MRELIKKLVEVNVDEVTLVNLLYPIIVTIIGMVISYIARNRREKKQAKIAAVIINNEIKETKKELKNLYKNILKNFKAVLIYSNLKENIEEPISSEDFGLVIKNIDNSLEEYDLSYILYHETSLMFLEIYCATSSESYQSLFKNSYFNLKHYASLHEKLYLISGYSDEADINKLIKFDNERRILISKIENILQNIVDSDKKPIINNIVDIKELLEKILVFLEEDKELNLNL